MKYRAFVEAAKSGSLTAAAVSLNYTQPGISHMISSLEQEFGFQLLYRSKSGVSLTEAGKTIFMICQELLERQDTLENTVKQINGTIGGTLRIGSYLSVMMQWMPDLIKEISRRFPELELQLYEGSREEQIQMLKSNEVDVGILSSSAPEGCDFIPVHKDPAVVILPPGHPLCEKSAISTDDLLRYPVLCQPGHSSEVLKGVFGMQYATIKGKLLTRSDQALLRLVKSGVGVGVVGRLVVRETDSVEIRKLSKPYERTVGLVVPQRKAITPALYEFIKVVCEKYQDPEFRGNFQELLHGRWHDAESSAKRNARRSDTADAR